jgi:hypothetical protein
MSSGRRDAFWRDADDRLDEAEQAAAEGSILSMSTNSLLKFR